MYRFWSRLYEKGGEPFASRALGLRMLCAQLKLADVVFAVDGPESGREGDCRQDADSPRRARIGFLCNIVNSH